jgi:hypothetical protein
MLPGSGLLYVVLPTGYPPGGPALPPAIVSVRLTVRSRESHIPS